MDYRTQRLQLAYDMMIKGPRDEKIAATKADWEQAEADLRKAKWRLDNTEIRAPIKGIILSKKAEENNMVNPSAFSNGLSASLCEMADLTRMEVDLAIAERDISKVFDGQECIVRAEAFPERTYVGWVSRRMPTADRSKGAVPVRVQIKIPREEEGQYLRPEMGAVVTFFNKKIDPEKKK
jgi:multidrug resistance efflux pump